MRILFWHGYLLGGTGSNVYTRSVVREWTRAGHEIVLVCQEPRPEEFDLGDVEVVRPELPERLLPVFVVDRYEGLEAKPLLDFSPDQRERYVEANAAALREHLPADLVFCNHVLMGAPVGAATGARFAVKVHGSELEYAMRQSAELALWGQETLVRAEAVFVGSEHIRSVLEELVGALEGVHEVPPGVDTDEFRPASREESLDALLEEAVDDPPNPGNRDERFPDESNAERFEAFFADQAPVVIYVGKLLYNKGVHVLLEAMQGVEARALIVGFGDYRRELESLAPMGTLFTGALEHRHLVHLLPLADASVVPSIFPEAFGMVAAEAAAAGVPPVVARHSGLADVAAGLEAVYPDGYKHLASFESGNALELADRLRELLALSASTRAELGAAARRTAEERWSWRSVAERLLDPFN